ncbi:MAG: phosphonate utilization associated transcriptional regulator [Betaproteobacteria bacterium]|nr:phosphonate utilization associated transcriptional regulator [Betaproteobacteria bacterium]
MSLGDTRENPLKLVRVNSLSVLVQEEIERMILSGEIATGEWLNESSLAQRFGLSRGPVREAFRALGESGLVRIVKNQGVFVREVSVVEADQIYDLREALDELVGRKVAATATRDQIKILHELLDEMDTATGANDVTRYHTLNLRFHDLLVESTANAKLIITYRRLIKELHLFRLRGLAQFGGLRNSNEEHRMIVKAIELKDAETAGRALKAHVVKSRDRMHKAYGVNAAD